MTFSGLQKVTLIDYPGKVACTLFTHGCNFKCTFCHNPELVVAPEGRHQTMDDTEALEFLKRRVGKLDGVCITGGEPLLHAGLKGFIEKVKEMGFYVKLDTNGSFPDRLQELVDDDLINYVAMDVKADEEHYQEVSASQVDIKDIKRSISIIKESEKPYEFRTTYVRGIHTNDTAEGIGELIDRCDTYFVQNFKYSKTIDPELDEHASFSMEELERFKKILLNYSDHVHIRE